MFTPPRLRVGSGDEEPRHATWLELLYDLAYVAAVASLADLLVAHITWPHVLASAALFVPVWWSWVGHAFYANRFDTDDLGHRLLTAVQMLFAVGMAAGIPQATHGSGVFAASYVGARLALIASYGRAYRHVPLGRPLIARYVAGFTVAAALWAVSLAFPAERRPWLWAAAMVIDIGTALVSRRFQRTLPPQPHHLPERFGLFFVIVLGEVVAAVAFGVSHVSQLGFSQSATAAAALVAVVGLWFTYFDGLDREVVTRTAVAGQLWVYLHPILYISVAAGGAAAEAIIGNPHQRAAAYLAAATFASAWLAVAGIAACSGRWRLAGTRAAAAIVIAATALLVAVAPGWVVLASIGVVSGAAGLAHLVLPLGFSPTDFSD